MADRPLSSRWDVYVASSWKNKHMDDVLAALRGRGLSVYDFRDPMTAFNWRQVHDAPFPWHRDEVVRALAHPLARRGFKGDTDAMKASRVCVLVLPCGRSAHMEAGWMAGAGRPVFVYMPEPGEPDSAHIMATSIETTLRDLCNEVAAEVVRPVAR